MAAKKKKKKGKGGKGRSSSSGGGSMMSMRSGFQSMVGNKKGKKKENAAMWGGFLDEFGSILEEMSPDALHAMGAAHGGTSPQLPDPDELRAFKEAQARLMAAAKKKLLLAKFFDGDDLSAIAGRLDSEIDDAVRDLKRATGPKKKKTKGSRK